VCVKTAIFWFLWTLFGATQTLYSLNVGACLLLLSPRSLARIRFIPCLIALCAIPIPVVLYTVGYWMWLEPGTGEANYLYFQCLAYNIFVTVWFLEFTSASLLRDKALRWTQSRNEGTDHE
jgi:GPI-anchor transamidase subunit U